MDLNEIKVFIQVVRSGSFSMAARQLGMPNSTVSAKVSSLEKRLGTTLIRRTTRRLSVTPAGQSYFQKCVEGFAQIQAAENEISSEQGEPRGLLRVTAPVDLGMGALPDLITGFLKKYPDVRLEVLLTDRRVDLLAEGIDLAIRAGELKDSTLIAKKLGSSCFAPFASPKYLKSKGQPKTPRELSEHQLLHFTPLGSESWQLIGPRGPVHISVPGRVLINDLHMLRNLALNGGGIALLPTFFIHPDVKAGRLVRVLEEWRTPLNPVHFVYPAQKFVTPKLSAFIEETADGIRQYFKDVEN